MALISVKYRTFNGLFTIWESVQYLNVGEEGEESEEGEEGEAAVNTVGLCRSFFYF